MTKNILLISSDQRRSLRVQIALLRYGLMVEVTNKAKRGLAIAHHRPPTAIVIDESFPEIDYTSLSQALNATPETSRIPVLTLPHKSAAKERLWSGWLEPADTTGPELAIEQHLLESLQHVGVI